MTSPTIATVELREPDDLVLARQRSREIAGLVGLDRQDQTRLATAVSEVARAALRRGGGRAGFGIESAGRGQSLVVTVEGGGPAGEEAFDTAAVRRLVDRCDARERAEGGAAVTLAKRLPAGAPALDQEACDEVSARLSRLPRVEALEELRLQNRELAAALQEADAWRREREALRTELDATNRGVLALYSELDDRSHQLVRAHEQKAKFISGLGHELRTPINSVVALARLLLERRDGALTAEQERQVGYIERAGVEMGRLVDEVLELSRAEAKRSPLMHTRVAVGTLFRSLGALLRPLADAAGVRLVFERPRGVPALVTDEGKLAQIVRNLVTNALRATESGTVRVAARAAGDDGVRFTVTDTGCGIAAEDHERIFDEFVQVGAPARGGTGLGLSLSRSLAELLGGRLWLEASEPGRGSTFAVELPLRPPPDGSAAERALAPPLAGRRVLLIEDDEATRYVVRTRLEEEGAVVVEEHTGAGGAARVDADRPDLVVLDLSLPDMDGASLLGRLRDREATRELPVVVYTAAELSAGARAGLERLGAVVVLKDQRLGELLEAVRSASPPKDAG